MNQSRENKWDDDQNLNRGQMKNLLIKKQGSESPKLIMKDLDNKDEFDDMIEQVLDDESGENDINDIVEFKENVNQFMIGKDSKRSSKKDKESLFNGNLIEIGAVNSNQNNINRKSKKDSRRNSLNDQ